MMLLQPAHSTTLSCFCGFHCPQNKSWWCLTGRNECIQKAQATPLLSHTIRLQAPLGHTLCCDLRYTAAGSGTAAPASSHGCVK